MSKMAHRKAAASGPEKRPRVLAAAAKGIASDEDFVGLADAIICDLLEGTLSHQDANVAFRGLGLRLQHAIAASKAQGGKRAGLIGHRKAS